MHKMLIKCMLIDHIHISRLKFEYKISKSCLQDKLKHNVFHAQDANACMLIYHTYISRLKFAYKPSNLSKV